MSLQFLKLASTAEGGGALIAGRTFVIIFSREPKHFFFANHFNVCCKIYSFKYMLYHRTCSGDILKLNSLRLRRSAALKPAVKCIFGHLF